MNTAPSRPLSLTATRDRHHAFGWFCRGPHSLAVALLTMLTAVGCDRGRIDVAPPSADRIAAVAAERRAEGDGVAQQAAGEANVGTNSAGQNNGGKRTVPAAAVVPADEADEGRVVDAPAAATPGDALGPLPSAVRRLGRGMTAAGGVALEPDVACDQLAPDAAWKLTSRTVINRLPAKAGEPTSTVELCLFQKWLSRKDEDKHSRTGKQHLFVAAFPGSDVAAWTSDELEFTPASLPADAAVSASGWAAALPTGLAEMPALAVASARFFDGALGEQVHYRRVGRVLRKSRGRWAFTELETIDIKSLDLAHIDATCGVGGPAGCPEALAAAAAWRKDAKGREHRRADRLAGKTARVPGHDVDGDPQSEWLREAYADRKHKKANDAALNALRVEVACGEAVTQARELFTSIGVASGGVEQAEPSPKAGDLCAPLADKGGPPRK
jgi:hypothetical protein